MEVDETNINELVKVDAIDIIPVENNEPLVDSVIGTEETIIELECANDQVIENVTNENEFPQNEKIETTTTNLDDIKKKAALVCDALLENIDENHEETIIDTANYFPKYHLENKVFKQVGCIEYPNDEQQNYIRGCKWSPDGTCLLYVVRGNGMAVVELPPNLYSVNTVSTNISSVPLKPVLQIPENAMVYDFCWFPGMNSQDPATCCWLTSCQHAPVQLWDAFTGQLRCTYRGYDLVDEVEAALSVNFSTDGQQIYCGYRKALRTFNVDRPGRDFTYYKMSYPITCIATNFAQPGQIALGSWNKTIELADDRLGTIRTLKKLTGHFGGVTHLKFSPDGTCLYSGARKDNEIICWDLRSPGRPLFSVNRLSDTNQRIYFDISPCGSLIFTAGTNGFVKVWNLLENSSEVSSKFKEYEIPVHNDSVNSISVHPYRPIIATGSGQHHFFHSDKEYIDENIFEIKHIENSIRLWWLGEVNEETLQDDSATITM